MKQKKLLHEIRKGLHEDRVWTPGRRGKRTGITWPICLTCGREVYSVNMEDVGPDEVEVRVKCGHGNPNASFEDYAKVKLEWHINPSVKEDPHKDDTDPEVVNYNKAIEWALRSVKWFDPSVPEK